MFERRFKKNSIRRYVVEVLGISLVLGMLGIGEMEKAVLKAENTSNDTAWQDKKQVIKQDKEDTLYGIGSVSKMYTTVAIMQLVDKGKITLDTPIINYLPEFQMADERYKDITVRMLLNHSSGLMGTTYTNSILYGEGDTQTYDGLLESLKDQRLKASPGQYSTYCNDGFALAEVIVERISGESFTDYLQHHIFEPLKLQQSSTHINRVNAHNQVKTYFDASTLIASEYCTVIGTGGILSTAEEVCQFGEIFVTGNNTLLSEDAIEEMSHCVSNTSHHGYFKEGSMENYGLGWDSINANPFNKYGIKTLIKGGDMINQHASLVVLPEEDISVAVLSSGGSSVLNTLLAEEIAKIALEESDGDKLTSTEVKEMVTDNEIVEPFHQIEEIPTKYLSYEGSYANNSGIYHLSFEEGKLLKLESCDNDIKRVQLYHYTDEDLFISEDMQYINDQGMTSPSGLETGQTKLMLKTLEDGKRYICIESDLIYAEIGECQLSGMFAEQLEQDEVSVPDIWKKRNGKKYYLTSEKSSSTFWTTYPTVKLNLSTEKEGYINAFGRMTTAKITGENEAESFVTISGGMGRDLNDIAIVKTDKYESIHLKDSDLYYIEEGAIPQFELSQMPIKIEDKGANWYAFDEQVVGQILDITVSGNAAVYIYNKDDACIYSSYMQDRGNKVIIPQDGKMVVINENTGCVILNKA